MRHLMSPLDFTRDELEQLMERWAYLEEIAENQQ